MAVRTTSERDPGNRGSAETVEPATAEPFAVTTLVAGRSAVLRLSGRVDLTALPRCRRAVDTLLRAGAIELTLDLQVAHFDDESIALLALMRRYALRHGGRLVLTEIPPHVARVLHRTGVSWLYRNDLPTADDPAPEVSLEQLTGDGPPVEAVPRPSRWRRA